MRVKVDTALAKMATRSSSLFRSLKKLNDIKKGDQLVQLDPETWHEEHHCLGHLVASVGSWGTGAFDPKTPISVKTRILAVAQPEVTIIVPVFNQAERIEACLDSIEACASLRTELLVIDDASRDGTLVEIEKWSANTDRLKRSNLVSLTVVSMEGSVFETLCDTVGVALARSAYCIDVQADMILADRGFDQRIVQAFRQVDDLILVSGRGGHSWDLSGLGKASRRRLRARAYSKISEMLTKFRGAYKPLRGGYGGADQVGRIGALVEVESSTEPAIYIQQSVMRGPLGIDRAKFKEVGGFDTSCFFLGNDDHDLSYRAWWGFGYRVGYVPTNFLSPLDAGSTRHERPEEDEQQYQQLRRHYDIAAADSALARRPRLDGLIKPERIQLRETNHAAGQKGSK